ncbi:hypothetical protein PSPO01_14871 [Paraphaeosphaeria sporulosa]
MSSKISVKEVFTNVEPFRSSVLRMLLPSEITSLLAALGCTVSPWERSTHMDIMHEIFQDFQDLVSMQNLGLTVRVFGSDLDLLNKKIQDPWAFRNAEDTRRYYIFIIISDEFDGAPRLHKDFRSNLRQNSTAEDMDVNELSQRFPEDVAENVAMLSKWMLCTPHLTGSLPGKVPGWIPVFKTHKHIVLRTYVSSYSEYRTKILYMERTLIRRVFGHHHKDLLAHVCKLPTICYLLQNNTREKKELNGRLTMNTIRDVYMPLKGPLQKGYVIVNAIPPLDAAVILHLP